MNLELKVEPTKVRAATFSKPEYEAAWDQRGVEIRTDIQCLKFPKHHKTDIAKLGLSPLFANLCKLVGYAKPAKSTGSQASIVIDPLPRSPKHSMISGYLPKSVLVLRTSIVIGLS